MNKEIKTDNFIISENSPAYIIAEIGINHNGQYELAKQLIIESAIKPEQMQLSFKKEMLIQ